MKKATIDLNSAKQFVEEGGTESKLDQKTEERAPFATPVPYPPPPAMVQGREEITAQVLARLATADFGRGINLRFPAWLDMELEDYIHRSNREIERTQTAGERPRRLTKQRILAEALVCFLIARGEVFK